MTQTIVITSILNPSIARPIFYQNLSSILMLWYNYHLSSTEIFSSFPPMEPLGIILLYVYLTALRGSTTEEDAAVMSLCNSLEDMRDALFPIRFLIVSGQLSEGEERKAKCDEFYSNHFSKMAEQLEKQVTDEFLFSKV